MVHERHAQRFSAPRARSVMTPATRAKIAHGAPVPPDRHCGTCRPGHPEIPGRLHSARPANDNIPSLGMALGVCPLVGPSPASGMRLSLFTLEDHMKRCSFFRQWHGLVLCGLISLGTVMVTEPIVQAEQYSFRDLGTLGGGPSSASGINNTGEVVGWSFVPGYIQHAFLYKNRMIMSLSIGGHRPFAYGINDSEQIVGQTDSTGAGHAFIYDHGALTLLPVPTNSRGNSVAYGINTSGQVVGAYFTSATGYAFLYSHGTMTDINVWGGRDSVAYDINDSGHVVGVAAAINGGPRRAFLYHNGEMKDLGTLVGDTIDHSSTSAAYSINNSGQVVGQSAFAPKSLQVHAVLYNPGEKPKDLGSPPGITIVQSSAKGINKSGQIVGWYSIAGYGARPFINQNGSMHDLNSLLDSSGAGWTLTDVTAINDHGQIVGTGRDRLGHSAAFLLTPVPHP